MTLPKFEIRTRELLSHARERQEAREAEAWWVDLTQTILRLEDEQVLFFPGVSEEGAPRLLADFRARNPTVNGTWEVLYSEDERGAYLYHKQKSIAMEMLEKYWPPAGRPEVNPLKFDPATPRAPEELPPDESPVCICPEWWTRAGTWQEALEEDGGILIKPGPWHWERCPFHRQEVFEAPTTPAPEPKSLEEARTLCTCDPWYRETTRDTYRARLGVNLKTEADWYLRGDWHEGTCPRHAHQHVFPPAGQIPPEGALEGRCRCGDVATGSRDVERKPLNGNQESKPEKPSNICPDCGGHFRSKLHEACRAEKQRKETEAVHA